MQPSPTPSYPFSTSDVGAYVYKSIIDEIFRYFFRNEEQIQLTNKSKQKNHVVL